MGLHFIGLYHQQTTAAGGLFVDCSTESPLAGCATFLLWLQSHHQFKEYAFHNRLCSLLSNVGFTPTQTRSINLNLSGLNCADTPGDFPLNRKYVFSLVDRLLLNASGQPKCVSSLLSIKVTKLPDLYRTVLSGIHVHTCEICTQDS